MRDDNLTGPGTCGVTAAGGTPGRCGYGPRLPLIVISPHAKHNYVDHRLADQASILRFIEDNWNRGRIGGGSFEKKAGTLNDFFDFSQPATNHRLILDRRLNLQIASMALSFARGHEFGAQANRKMHRGRSLGHRAILRADAPNYLDQKALLPYMEIAHQRQQSRESCMDGKRGSKKRRGSPTAFAM